MMKHMLDMSITIFTASLVGFVLFIGLDFFDANSNDSIYIATAVFCIFIALISAVAACIFGYFYTKEED